MTLAAAALVLIAVACADGLLRWLIRRKFRHAEAARAPLLTLLWVYGVSASASLVLLDLEFLAAADKALRALKAVTQVGWLVGLVWLLWRLGGALERWLKARAERQGSTWDRILFPLAGRAARLMAPLVVLILGVPALPLPPGRRGRF